LCGSAAARSDGARQSRVAANGGAGGPRRTRSRAVEYSKDGLKDGRDHPSRVGMVERAAGKLSSYEQTRRPSRPLPADKPPATNEKRAARMSMGAAQVPPVGWVPRREISPAIRTRRRATNCAVAHAFAGLRGSWRGVRGPKSAPVQGEHQLFGFLTTGVNAIVAPIGATSSSGRR
jgi:hypothetical protein